MKPTQVNKASPETARVKHLAVFLSAFCHPSLDLRRFSHITHRDNSELSWEGDVYETERQAERVEEGLTYF